MTGSGTGFAGGVTYSKSMKLPAGSWGYRFEATSGNGAGTQLGRPEEGNAREGA